MHNRRMDRRQFLTAFGLGAASVLLPRPGAWAAPAKPPNVVVFVVDDLGWRDLGCYGSTFYETPNVDRLAREGVRFTDAYAACPVCSPTRASLLTGRYPTRTGITNFIGAAQPGGWDRNTRLLPAPYTDRLAHDEVTLPEAFQAAGYATFFAGKWHLGPRGFWPEDQGFQINKGGTDRGGPYGGKKYFSPYDNPRLPDGPAGEHLPDRLASETIAFIESCKDRPFLAYFSFYSVHTPLMAREDLRVKYEAKAGTVKHDGPDFLPEGARMARQVQDHAVYAGMVEAMDQAVGRVLEALHRLNLADRTVVVFTSDNGGLSTSEGSPTSNVPLRAGKGWMYEGGLRVPLIVKAPGVTRAGGVCGRPATSTDLFPTLLELAGLPAQPERHVDGVSLVSTLKGGAPERGPLYWHFPHYGNQGGQPGGAIREGDWKLIEWYEDGRLELFNLREDPGEQHNLAEAHPDRVKRLHEGLRKWRTDTGARMPAPNPRYRKT